MDRLKSEPAVVIGALAAVILAAVQTAAGHELISGDLAAILSKALDPSGGWAIPLIVGIVTRFFVSPAK